MRRYSMEREQLTFTSLLYLNFLVVLHMDQPMKRLSARVEMRLRAGLMQVWHGGIQSLLLDPGYWLSSSSIHCHAKSARRTTVSHHIPGATPLFFSHVYLEC